MPQSEYTDLQKRSKRIAANTLMLFARMLIITFVNLYTVRWVLKGLGLEDYGIYNAIAGVVTTSTCLSSVLALSTQRFYSFAMGQNDSVQLKKIFSVSLNITVLLAAVLFVGFEFMGPWFIQSQLSIPAIRLTASLTIFHFSLVAFICALVQIPFIGAVFANEDMGIYAVISTADCIMKLVIALLVSQSPTDHLITYGAALMAEAILVLASYIIIARKKYPECSYVRVKEKGLYRQLTSFSGWTLYGTVASMGMTQGSIILLNIFFGPLVNAAFNIANQVYNALNTLANSICVPMRPAIIKAYSQQEEKYMNSLFYASNKAILYLMIIVAVPLTFEAETILSFWLGKCSQEMVLFTRLYMLFTVIMSLHNPITTIIQASGSIRRYTLFVESVTILNIPACWLLFKLGLPSWSLFATMISLCILAHIMRLYHLRRICPAFTYSGYATTFLLPGILITAIAALVGTGICRVAEAGILRLALHFTLLPLATIVLIYLVGINRQEKQTIVQIIRKKINR